MRRVVLLALLLAPFGTGAAWAQDRGGQQREMRTDRPDKTESPFTVDAGHVQLEMDLAAYTHDRDGDQRSDTLQLAPINLRFGLDASTDLHLIFGGYGREIVRDRAAGTREVKDGVGDLTIRLKRNLWGNDDGTTALAVLPFVKLPTASGGLGNGAVEGGVIVPFSAKLSDKVSLAAMTELDLIEREGASRLTPGFVYSASLSVDLTDRISGFGEIYTEKHVHDPAWIATFDTGLALKLGDDLQFDAGVNIGLTRAADDVNPFIGLSRRF